MSVRLARGALVRDDQFDGVIKQIVLAIFSAPGRLAAKTPAHEGWIRGGQAMTDKTAHIGEIVQVMLNSWDLPADCNEGELFTYAETLYDQIIAGDSKDKLYAYLSEVQVDHLEMAKSEAFRAIVDRAVELSGRPR